MKKGTFQRKSHFLLVIKKMCVWGHSASLPPPPPSLSRPWLRVCNLVRATSWADTSYPLLVQANENKKKWFMGIINASFRLKYLESLIFFFWATTPFVSWLSCEATMYPWFNGNLLYVGSWIRVTSNKSLKFEVSSDFFYLKFFIFWTYVHVYEYLFYWI